MGRSSQAVSLCALQTKDTWGCSKHGHLCYLQKHIHICCILYCYHLSFYHRDRDLWKHNCRDARSLVIFFLELPCLPMWFLVWKGDRLLRRWRCNDFVSISDCCHIEADAYYSYFYPYGFTWLAHSSLLCFQAPHVKLLSNWYFAKIQQPKSPVSMYDSAFKYTSLFHRCTVWKAFVFLVLWSHFETTVCLLGTRRPLSSLLAKCLAVPRRAGRSSLWISCRLK